ncbi:hypothetical protein QC762_0046700 [Podospora pseudocomata]|uniref:Uncharacterized protein n=1 Tax=Podospora pseudocomata TaxID=2093779 RepID=A0ABR0GPC8_9PEZI|nr:hypothetical protein QC762_0046700 [Podospora pseudocomata]
MSYCLAPYFTVSSHIFDRVSASFVSIYAKQWMNNLAMNGPDYATLQPNHKSLLRVMFALIIPFIENGG